MVALFLQRKVGVMIALLFRRKPKQRQAMTPAIFAALRYSPPPLEPRSEPRPMGCDAASLVLEALVVARVVETRRF